MFNQPDTRVSNKSKRHSDYAIDVKNRRTERTYRGSGGGGQSKRCSISKTVNLHSNDECLSLSTPSIHIKNENSPFQRLYGGEYGLNGIWSLKWLCPGVRLRRVAAGSGLILIMVSLFTLFLTQNSQ